MAAPQLVRRINDALLINPPAGDAHITIRASNWLWAVLAVMLLSWFAALGWSFASRRHNRIFHYIPSIVLAVACVSYFSMASDLGWTLVRSEFDSHPTRQVWFVRYIQWFINAPLVLLALLSFTRLATPHILSILFFAWFLVVNGLVGALVPSSYKWGYFVFGMFGLFYIWYQMLVYIPLKRSLFTASEFRTGFFCGAAYLSFVMIFYPVCWGLSEGSNTISPTSEMIFYGILDILTGPVFLLTFMVSLSDFDEQQLDRTAFGSANRGEYGEYAQKAARQEPAAAPGDSGPPAAPPV